MKILKSIARKFKTKLLPSEHDKTLQSWYLDNGEEVLRLEYPDLDEQSIVMDLGGYKGQWASDIYSKYNCQVLVFEPVCTYANNIAKRFSKNANIKVFNFALGDSNHQDIITLSNDGSSTFKPSSGSNQTEIINYIDIEQFLTEQSITNIDLIKINIEGGEYDLLPNIISAGVINRIKHLQIQFHDLNKRSKESMNKIHEELNKTHKITYQYTFVWENWVRK